MKFWISVMSILAIVSFRIAYLNVLAVDGRGHHVLLTSAVAISLSTYRRSPHTFQRVKEQTEAAVI
jgi:hypothetical protein